jgi:hypothetical protein
LNPHFPPPKHFSTSPCSLLNLQRTQVPVEHYSGQGVAIGHIVSSFQGTHPPLREDTECESPVVEKISRQPATRAECVSHSMFHPKNSLQNLLSTL